MVFKKILFILILPFFLYAQWTDPRPKSIQLWHLNTSFFDSLGNVVADSLAVLSADGVTIVNDGTFKQKVFADTTTLKAATGAEGNVVVLKQLAAGNATGGGLFVWKTTGAADTYNVFAGSGGYWHRLSSERLSSYDRSNAPTGIVGTLYYNTYDSSLSVFNGSSYDKLYTSRDQINNDQWKNPLEIPTPDGNPSVTHPSVQFFPESWNGYRYWMAFTPYPGAVRENPCVVASNDGVRWVEPVGIDNPVAPLADAISDGFAFQSDTDFLLYQDTLFLYYRPILEAPGEGIYRRWSSDGITWGGKLEILRGGVDIPAATTEFVTLSPSFVNIGDSLIYMYTIADTGTGLDDYQLLRWSSTDGGKNFSSPATICDYGRVSGATVVWSLWHIDVVRVDDIYYMIGLDRLSTEGFFYRYRFFKSTDGINFTRLGGTLDAFNSFGDTWNYRASLVPRSGNPLSFDVYGVAVADTGSGTDVFTNTHRIVLYRDVRLKDIATTALGDYVHLNREIDTTQDTIALSGAFSWANVTGWTKTYGSESFTFLNDTLSTSTEGLYEFNGYVTILGSTGHRWQIRLLTTGSLTGQRYQPILYINDSQYHSFPFSGYVNLTNGTSVNLQIRNLTDGTDAIIYNGALSFKRIGDIE